MKHVPRRIAQRPEETDDLRQGVSAGLGADTKAGPLVLTYGAADGGDNRLYLSLGTVF